MIHNTLRYSVRNSALYTSIFTDKTKLQLAQSMNKHLHVLAYPRFTEPRLDGPSWRSSSRKRLRCMHGVAGFTAKLGRQATVETVVDPEGPAGVDP